MFVKKYMSKLFKTSFDIILILIPDTKMTDLSGLSYGAWEAAKNVLFLVVRPLRRGGG